MSLVAVHQFQEDSRYKASLIRVGLGLAKLLEEFAMEISALPFVLAICGALGLSALALFGFIVSDLLSQRPRRSSQTSARAIQTNPSSSDQHPIAA
jgi:hypothetical protein